MSDVTELVESLRERAKPRGGLIGGMPTVSAPPVDADLMLAAAASIERLSQERDASAALMRDLIRETMETPHDIRSADDILRAVRRLLSVETQHDYIRRAAAIRGGSDASD
jgi:hypothetical protein